MIENPTYQEKFDRLKVCVLVPTYNNSGTLGTVISGVLKITRNIVVVNDGSTDETPDILNKFPEAVIISLPQNKGKGNALRAGFNEAIRRGYEYVISIDSDGQHFPEDLPKFIEKLEQERNAIIIGARNMEQSGIPGKSSFGHKFSNFWFKVETGIETPDTQSGYRLYPLSFIRDRKFFTRKFEFEIEVIVRAAWSVVKIESVPVTVYYAKGGERVTHFRPFIDFTRISILNTILVIISFLYIKPRYFLKEIFIKKKFREVLQGHLFNKHESDFVKSSSIAFGIFMGIVPIWGFQMMVGLALAILLRLNKALVIIAANISVPPMIPIIIYLSYRMGTFATPDSMQIKYDKGISFETIGSHTAQYIYGSITLAVIAAILFGIISWLFLKLFKRRVSLDRHS